MSVPRRGPALVMTLAVLALGACVFWRDAPEEADGDATSAPAVPAPGGVGARVGRGADTVPTLLARPGGPVSTVAPDSTEGGPTVTDPAGLPTRAGSAASEAQLSLIRARLDQIALAQSALSARLDSLSDARPARGAPAASDTEVVVEKARNLGLAVVSAILVAVLFNLFIHGLVWVLDALAERSVARRLFFKKLVPITRILLWVLAAYIIVRGIFQVDAQTLLAAAAAVGVAVGFAAQDLLKNLFGGIILVFDQPFQVGDKISVAGTYGEVVSIGLRSTRLVTPDDNLVSVPNAQVVDGQVANANAGQLHCQVVTDLFLPGFVDEARAKRIAFEAAASSKYVYLNKPIVVLVKDEFKETFLTHLKVKAYVLDPRFEFLFQSDVTERARAGFRDAGILQEGHGLRAYLDVSRIGVPAGAEPARPDAEDAGD